MLLTYCTVSHSNRRKAIHRMSCVSGFNVVVLATICVIVLATGPSVRTVLAQNTPDDFVNDHNAARAAVGLGPVSWDEAAAAYASNYANERINDCQLIYSGGPYGENVFSGVAGVDWTAQDAVDSWVSGQLYYDYASYTCSAGQVLSRVSTGIGCARVVCTNGGGIFITCNYSPPDNV